MVLKELELIISLFNTQLSIYLQSIDINYMINRNSLKYGAQISILYVYAKPSCSLISLCFM